MKHDTFLHDAVAALQHDAALVPMDSWVAFKLTGEDVVDWLQGQITNDIKAATVGSPLDFCMCKPTGQMELDGLLWRLQDSVIMLVPKICEGVLQKRCEEMVIMEDVQCQSLSETHEIVSIQGPNAGRIAIGMSGVVLASGRAGFAGMDIVIERGISKPNLPSLNQTTWELLLLEAGIPIFGIDMNEKTLPPEMGPVFDGSHVSYRKGCYTGQEVLMRIYSRGHTNKTWTGLLSERPLERGGKVLDREGAEVGQITNAHFSPHLGYIGAAMLRNNVEGSLTTTSGEPLAIRSMPIIESATQLRP